MSDIAVDGATPENVGRLGGAQPPVVRENEQFVRAMIENMEPDPDENMRPGRGRPRILPVCTITAISGKEETQGAFPRTFQCGSVPGVLSIWAVFSPRARASGARQCPWEDWR